MMKIKKDLILLLILLTFLLIPSALKAESYLSPTDESILCGKAGVSCSTVSKIDRTTKIKDAVTFDYYRAGGAGVGTRKLNNIIEYVVKYTSSDKQTNKSHIVYCIEPNYQIVSNTPTYQKRSYDGGAISEYGETTSPIKEYSNADIKWNESKAQMIREAMNYVHGSDKTESDYYELIASQGFIWEIIGGERTNFNSERPNKALENGFYKKIFEKSWDESQFPKDAQEKIQDKYKLIRNKVYYVYHYNPGDTKFRSDEINANTVKLYWNEKTKMYEATIKDPNNAFKYYYAEPKQNDLIITKSDDKILIQTSSYNPSGKEVEITNVFKKNGAETGYKYDSVLYSSNHETNDKYDGQDVVRPGKYKISKYIKIEIPKYQLKIEKESSAGEKLKDAEFEVFSDKECNNKITTLKTNSDGQAMYAGISKPGLYYVKETKAPAGYQKRNDVMVIEVKSTNTVGSSSYASLKVKNDPKEFTIIKTAYEEDGATVLQYGDICRGSEEESPEFEMRTSDNNLLKFNYDEDKNKYVYDKDGEHTKLKTCNSQIIVSELPECIYTVEETKAVKNLTLEGDYKQTVDVCKSGKVIRFSNGFNGVEFQKKNEDGEFIDGGKYTLQKNNSGNYEDTQLKKNNDGLYEYQNDLTAESGTYFIETKDGVLKIKGLPAGKYRIVEKEAPEGYEIIDESKVEVFTINNVKQDYQIITMIDRKKTINGSSASAELVVTITTGRKILNYALIIGGISLGIVLLIILRKKIKK